MPSDGFGKLQHPPRASGGCTQSVYIIVTGPDALHDRAVKAGAQIVMPLTDTPYGACDFSCLGRGGHLWNFGTYDPWATK